jgi:hypothetical protein
MARLAAERSQDRTAHIVDVAGAFAQVGVINRFDGFAQRADGNRQRLFQADVSFAHAPRHIMRQGLIFDEQRVGVEDTRFLQASLFAQDRCQRPKLTGSRCLSSNESSDRRIDVGIDHVPA